MLALLVGFPHRRWCATDRSRPATSPIASSSTASPSCAKTSPRRIWAIARLAIKESIRRRVIVALVVFFLILLFAGWFLQTGYPQPGKLFFSFVLTATTYSGAADRAVAQRVQPAERFQDRRRFTPSSPSPCGPATSCSAAFWASRSSARCCWRSWPVRLPVRVRMLDHTHEVEVETLEDSRRRRRQRRRQEGPHDAQRPPSPRRRDLRRRQRQGALDERARAHDHQRRHGGATEVRRFAGPKGICGPACRSTASLRFLDRNGARRRQAASASAASGPTAASSKAARRRPPSGRSTASTNRSCAPTTKASQYLPLELIVRVFRTYKGDIEQGIQGSIQLRNPDNPRRSRANRGHLHGQGRLDQHVRHSGEALRRPEADRSA